VDVERGLAVDNLLIESGEGAILEVSGNLGLGLTDTDLRLTGDVDLGLARLVDPGLAVAGLAAVELRLAGPPRRLVVSGHGPDQPRLPARPAPAVPAPRSDRELLRRRPQHHPRRP